MDRVEEIEAAIQGLPPQEYERLVEWFRAQDLVRWDEKQIATPRPANWIFFSRKPSVNPLRGFFASGRPGSELCSHPAFLGPVPLSAQRDTGTGCQKLPTLAQQSSSSFS